MPFRYPSPHSQPLPAYEPIPPYTYRRYAHAQSCRKSWNRKMLVLLPAFLLLFDQTEAQTMQSKCYSCATPNLKNNFLTTERGPGPKIAEPRIYDSYCGGDTWILKERATVNCDGYCFKWTQTLNNSGTFSSMTFRGCYRQMFDLNNQNVPREPTHSFCTFSEKPVPCLSDSSVVESSCWCQGDHCNVTTTPTLNLFILIVTLITSFYFGKL
ncbi:unnamed protein product, partial [Mesorhabditis spiculigera]